MVDPGLGHSADWPRNDSGGAGASAESLGKPSGDLAPVGFRGPASLGDRRPMDRRAVLIQRTLLGSRGAERVQDEVHRLIHLQALRLDLAFYDHTESYDQLHRTLAGNVGLGDLLLCFQAFQQCQLLLRSLLEGAGKMYKSLLFVENLDSYLELKPAILPGSDGKPGLPVEDSIRFENVGFTYPGSFHAALDGFNMELPRGKVIALVGHNGAGKSTLIKLLCRFYDPDVGRVLLDGTDLRKLDIVALRRRIAVLFQDPVHYHASVRENIAFGDLEGLSDVARVREAAQDAGALEPIERLPGEFEAVLGKWFGGAELSGGEWQRIALARAFFRRASLVILDEPTSSMDSWAEQDWLGRFRTLTEGRTALMITHRFTTAMHADIIHVLDKGRVMESGTHGELVALGATYASSWAAQMREIGHA